MSGGERRTLAPPERRRTEITANEKIGAYSLITSRDPDGPGEPRPGQFYMLASAERWGGGEGERPYLPRAFSYARARPGPDGVELSFLLEDVGPGTHRLGELRPGDGLHVLGPLGIGFTPPPDGRRAVLCGGGIGAAPLLCWQEEHSGGAEVLVGFRSAAHAEGASLFAGAPTVVTDDGSVGRQALVTEPLRATLEDDPRAAVYACGPPAMLEGVRALCAELQVPAQLAMESGMACGFGACFGCVVPTREGFVRLCVDGPVLDAARLETAVTPGAGH
ncbi:MAG TPA: dihydroorotate dehydrogenase electron transfer subunit [Thermoleophilaceae bacterium]|nr:dihydroorotate dehydrogenase electron transfer subunit [Thermoleophilaceae bacterium]